MSRSEASTFFDRRSRFAAYGAAGRGVFSGCAQDRIGLKRALVRGDRALGRAAPERHRRAARRDRGPTASPERGASGDGGTLLLHASKSTLLGRGQLNPEPRPLPRTVDHPDGLTRDVEAKAGSAPQAARRRGEPLEDPLALLPGHAACCVVLLDARRPSPSPSRATSPSSPWARSGRRCWRGSRPRAPPAPDPP